MNDMPTKRRDDEVLRQIALPKELNERLKEAARGEGRTVKGFIAMAIREAVDRAEAGAAGKGSRKRASR